MVYYTNILFDFGRTNMQMYFIRVYIIFFLFLPTFGFAQSILQQYHMPPLERVKYSDNEKVKKHFEKARVLKRAQTVPIQFTTIEDPRTYQTNLRKHIQAQLPQLNNDIPHIAFNGDKTSALNQLLATLSTAHIIDLQGQTIEVDEPLILPANILLDGHNAVLMSTQAHFASVIIKQPHVGLVNLTIETVGLGIQVANTQQVILRNIHIPKSDRGITILGKSQFIELDQIFIQNPQAGIMIQGDVSNLWLHNSEVSNATRADNGGSALLITDAKLNPNIEAMSSAGALTEFIFPINHPAPHALLIENNRFVNSVAQGVYIDGGYGNVIKQNFIADNDKEGMCLDFGSVNNIVMENTFLRNGNRARQTDEDLKHDLVFDFGRLADGSSASKLPAIALDNAAQNIILWNIIRDSGGDGIKIVRTGIRNFFLFNTIMDNNRGQNSRLHFFGILLGSAGLEPDIDPNNHPLDFLPPMENIVAGNMIYGAHWAGILLDHEAAYNDIYDNMARHYLHYPLETAFVYHNSIVGNAWQPNTPPKKWWWQKLLQ